MENLCKQIKRRVSAAVNLALVALMCCVLHVNIQQNRRRKGHKKSSSFNVGGVFVKTQVFSGIQGFCCHAFEMRALPNWTYSVLEDVKAEQSLSRPSRSSGSAEEDSGCGFISPSSASPSTELESLLTTPPHVYVVVSVSS